MHSNEGYEKLAVTSPPYTPAAVASVEPQKRETPSKEYILARILQLLRHNLSNAAIATTLQTENRWRVDEQWVQRYLAASGLPSAALLRKRVGGLMRRGLSGSEVAGVIRKEDGWRVSEQWVESYCRYSRLR